MPHANWMAQHQLALPGRPTEATFSGAVHAGRSWNGSKAGYACAVGWSGRSCVTAYVSTIHFAQPVEIGQRVEVRAQLIYTGRTRMHIRISVHAADPTEGTFAQTTQCLVLFVAVDRKRAEPVQIIMGTTGLTIDNVRYRG